jgi:hypothetical protein
LQRDGREPPAEADFGMMRLVLGERRGALDKPKRLAEIPKAIRALDPRDVIEQCPIRRLDMKRLASPAGSGGMPPRQGVQFFSTSAMAIGLPPQAGAA